MSPLIQQQYTLDQDQVSLMTSIYYIGVALGSVLFGYLTNQTGRKAAIIAGIWIQLLSGTLLSLNLSYAYFVVMRFFSGVGFGSTVVSTILMVSESFAIEHRGRALLTLNFGHSLGKILASGLALVFFPSDTSTGSDYGFVTVYMLVSLSPCVLGLVLNWTILEESYRYLMLE